MTRAVIYARVSSEEQAGPDKSSIQTQLDDCRQLAAKLGWLVVGEYIDDRRYRVGKRQVEPSGTRADRPQWRKMLAELEAGRADALIAWHSTRLWRAYRPMVDALEIIEANHVQVQLVKDSFDVRFAVLQAWLGKQENEARIERTRFGHMARARKGLVATRATAYYSRLLDPGTGQILGYEFDERYRAAFDKMASLFLARVSYREIAKQLGTNPRTARPWSFSSVKDILANPYYRGQVQFGRRQRREPAGFVVPGQQKAVWDAAICAAIEAELARRAVTGHHAPRSHSAPLAGVLHCGYCGHLMSPNVTRRKPTHTPQRGYRCHTNDLVRRGYAPGQVHPPNRISEKAFLRLLRAEVADITPADVDEIVSLLASRAPQTRPDDSATRSELADVERQIAELEPDLALVRSPRARAQLDESLSDLRAQAALYREHLANTNHTGQIDLAAMRAALLALANCPDLARLPPAELRYLASAAFPVLFIRSGRIVPAPASAS